MEEQNQPHTSPIAGEPALLEALSSVDTLIDMKANPQQYMPYELEDQYQEECLKDLRWWMQKSMDAMRSEAEERLHDDGPASQNARTAEPMTLPALKPGMVVPRGALMGLRASLAFAIADYADTVDGWASIAGDLAHTIQSAMDEIDEMLGFKEDC